GDAGAHAGQICDASVPTFTLAYWVRRRRVLALEDAVKRLTLDPALLYGIHGRGLVRRGWAADLNVIDLARLGVREPEVRHDFPTGARHLSQRADGYLATIVNGRVVMRNGEHTGVLPGTLIRNDAGGGEREWSGGGGLAPRGGWVRAARQREAGRSADRHARARSERPHLGPAEPLQRERPLPLEPGQAIQDGSRGCPRRAARPRAR